jgi:hypothetical protein
VAGPWEKYGGQQGQVVSLPPDPMQQAQMAREEARLRLAQEAAARAAAGAPSANERALREQLLDAQVKSAQAAAKKALEGTAGAKTGDAKLQQRMGNLEALSNQLVRVRSLWEQNLKGGVPNWIVGNIPEGLRPENGAFESAAAGLGEIGLAAFRVPGIGSQSDTELRQFVNANTPKPGDSDAKIQEKLNNLQNRLDSTRKAMGVETSAAPQENLSIATGDTSTRLDKDKTSAIDAMIKRGAPYEQAAQRAKEWGTPPPDRATYAAAVRFAKANPGFKGSLAEVTFAAPTTTREQVTGALATDTPLGAFGVAAGNTLSAGLLDEFAGGDAQFAKDALRQQQPGATLAGDVVGSALGMTGLNAGLRGLGGRLAPLATRGGGIGGDALFGAAFGAGENNDNRLGGALTGAASAGAGNLLGRGLVSGAGGLATGVTDPAVQALRQRGISMSPGQILGQGGVFGRGYRKIEDAIESVPFLGAAIGARKTEGLTDFNREAFKDALAPIGQRADEIGQDGIGQAQELVSGAYGDALSGTSLRADLPFVMRANDAVQAGRRVPEFGADVDYLARENLGPMFGPGRSLDGEGFQSSLQDIAATKADFSKAGNVRGRNAANSMDELRQAYFDLAARQAPGTNEALSAANTANRNVSVLGKAVNTQGGPLITPSQLRRASVANTRKFGGERAAARGDVPFADLIQSGEAVLPNVVPNSGTTDRALAAYVLPAALGGTAAGSEALNLPAPLTALLALLAGASTKTGNKAVQKLLLDRPDAARMIGEELLKRRRAAGMFGAATAPGLLVGPQP